ncbi:MAG: cytochrome B [Candidatus Dactylopiibacterium carminicum]|uniref:Cytochrome B n=1 Tax=Candidatus Dactylopiibacterium carminicum TaxID=857335 RepID=A0A272EPL0_9RHOO|nr:cytochrome b [Candidatus Dactylopiibacterium carminicum]KAF7598335.1 cytochrome b [Candidatus Dactylopiibacterium carminicum]PAS92047.1 MAG: cytochrome B [Candidatus Dactylopiibacterium carminicum]PAS95474.1 MAG: cytochrome B [Candidatus Dactylopiibacterium carminicum]PAS97387.1 MAG: cytochrome B [Candidatus Dactylopiibacterium carminicum]
MQLKNTRERFGAIAGIYHWLIASAFILSYPFVYYVVLVLERDRTNPLFLPVLNVHWFLGILVGVLVIPRLIWRWVSVEPEAAPGSRVEHLLAKLAHWGLYALMIIMPATGYLGTGGSTSATIDLYLFKIPRFPNTELFQILQIDWVTFEPIMDGIHHFSGKWIAPVVVLLHIAAAFYHHFIRRDTVLVRMLPERVGEWLLRK